VHVNCSLEEAEIVLNTDTMSVEEEVEIVLNYLQEHRYLILYR